MPTPPAALAAARSFLIFPGDDGRKCERALASGADAVILDLEDGVAAARKDEARARLAAYAGTAAGPMRLVRVNDPMSAAGAADLAALAGSGVVAVVPKASLASVDRAAEAGLALVALVEDASAVRDVHLLAQHPAVVALALGSADLGAALGLVPRPDGLELAYVRSALVVASAAAGIRPPVDGPCLAVHDADALAREAGIARSLGVGGKLCIHPGQIEGVRRAFAPTAEEVEHARRVLAEWADLERRGDAVGLVDGRLVDLPVVQRARAVVDASERRAQA